ncbi:sigma-54-dependent Fis family transcriptional regulator [Pseudoroseomonas deserti]|uniref:Sigma-54-dependent Fis family transcriptional regulator n=1 Tax=Teichococcus deserti TaxID=1817963 RepID=A0A1V2GVQ5_9PROT|nr:sigma-54 dependent transcriptional regulator [Pseudoroseomonas deserti]ONG47263.1 sigma-54-dependent Fis family transcriptional regulator [Pseudoroseomonas deserti]
MTDQPGRLLLVDDEPAFCRLAAAWLERAGHRVVVAHDPEQAAARFAETAPEVVLLDLVMPPRLVPEAGLDLIPGFASVPVIVMTAHAEHDLALRAVERGAWDFLGKPVEPELLSFAVARALRVARLRREVAELRAGGGAEDLGLVGRSPVMARLRERIRRLGATSLPLIVLGPTGTGKELVARALHQVSDRRAGPFIAVHCGALPGELLESELFGHIKGAFTGAHRDRPGLVEAAHRGTLFLDEVGEMPPPMQVKLLRFLADGSFLPVGGREMRRAEVRIVAATHRDLEAMVAAGTFREDLFFRLKGFVMRTPALAERADDISLLAAVFLQRVAPGARLTPDALSWLAARDWPGNVRELRAVVETAGALATEGEGVDAALLRFAAGEAEEEQEAPPAGAGPGQLDAAIAALESRMLRQALAETGGNQSEAARRLGISRPGLIKKMARLGLR